MLLAGLWLPVPRKHLGGGLPRIFREPKNCYSLSPRISGHRTEKSSSMGFENQGLVFVQVIVLLVGFWHEIFALGLRLALFEL